MKIVFCTNTFENVQNGPSKFANYLLEMPSLYSHVEIRILTEDIDDSKLSDYNGQVVKVNPEINTFTRPWGFLYRMFPYYKACKKLQANYPYDIVVFNNAITGIWSALKLPVPVLGMINDYTSLSNSWNTFDGSWQWLRRRLFKYCERFACLVEDGILVNSAYLFDQVVKHYRTPVSRLKIVYKGLKIHPPTNHRVLFGEPVKVLFVKSDFVLGGLYDLIEALSLIQDYTFELYIVGPHLRFKNQILRANLAYNLRIVFIGPASQKKVYELMQFCDLFVVPSYKEALGVANLEALLNGIPVITSKVGGIPETLDHGNNGWMVDPGDPPKLAETIRYVMSHPEERSKKQHRGYSFVCNNFSFEKVAEQFLRALQEYHENNIRIK